MKTLVQTLYKNFPEDANPFGYIPESPKPNAAVYNRIFPLLGGAGASFDWRPFVSKQESQIWIPFCVPFSRLNCAETLGNKAGVNFNGSDRELGVISGTSRAGNTLEAVSEAFRLKGVRAESVVPFTSKMLSDGWPEWDDIFNIPPDKGEFRYKGGSHSWVFGRAAMVDALNYGPLQIAVGVGETWEDEIVKPPKNIQTYHAIELCYLDADGFMYINDSVGKQFKKLTPDYPLTGCKSFRDLPENWKEIMVKKYLVVDTTTTPNKLGVAVVEGFTGNFVFAKDPQAQADLIRDLEVPPDAKTLTLT